MPGTLTHDAAPTKLANAVDISSATTTTGTGVQVDRPGWVQLRMTTAAITGTSVTSNTEIQGSNDDSTYVTIAKFDTLTESDDSETHIVHAYVAWKYLRHETITTGTTPVVNDLTVTVEEPHYRRLDTDAG